MFLAISVYRMRIIFGTNSKLIHAIDFFMASATMFIESYEGGGNEKPVFLCS